MKIAFVGSYGSFDYHHIGGTDSIARRLGIELVNLGVEVSFVHFGCHENKTETTDDGITILYFMNFGEVLRYIARNFDHVVMIYVPPKHRLTWMLFRRNKGHGIKFHKLCTVWPESWIRHSLSFAEAIVIPYNGNLFGVSPHIQQYFLKWTKRSPLLLPPVPQDYFLKPDDKPTTGRINVTYMGRVDPGKGIETAINLFRILSRETPHIKTKICGYPWKHKPETIRLHEYLLSQDEIIYEPVEFEKFTPHVEKYVAETLKNTDILLLPYKKLSSTIDTPLLLLEAMASLCAVITKPFGNIPDIYGSSKFIAPEENFVEYTLELLKNVTYEDILEERKRIFERNKILDFRTSSVARRFLKALEECEANS